MNKRKRPHPRDENQNMSPRKRKKIQESGVDILPTAPRHVLKALEEARTVSQRRLRTIKRLRQNKRRLEKKNSTLRNVINDLKNKNLIDTESLDLLSSIGGKTQDLLLRLKRKSSNKTLPYPTRKQSANGTRLLTANQGSLKNLLMHLK